MNKTVGIVLGLLVVAGAIYLVARSPEDNNAEEGALGTGRIVFSVTDAAANMSQISEINMRISRVDIHSQTRGWTTVSTTPKTYDLLALNAANESKLLAEVEVEEGTYRQVRLMIDDVSVVTNAGATFDATLPANEMVIATEINAGANSTTSVEFDFLADKSLFTTTDGEYVFAPVVTTETRSGAGISISGEETVTIGGGTLDDSSTFGMDVDGSAKLDFELNSTQRLDIENNAIIKLETLVK